MHSSNFPYSEPDYDHRLDKTINQPEKNKNMKSGIELIAEERQRQISGEGWTAEHDLGHSEGELSLAALCYCLPDKDRRGVPEEKTGKRIPFFWPWSAKWWKPTPNNRIRELVKAGALIAAEIDRLQAAK